MKLLLFFVLMFGLSLAAVFKHQLIRIESRKTRMIKEGTWDEHVELKQSRRQQFSRFNKVTQLVNDYDDNEYLANVTVGTPPQTFLVVLDTGSADFWIPDSSCGTGPAYCPSPESCAFECEKFCYQNCCEDSDGGNGTTEAEVCSQKIQFNAKKSSTYAEDGDSFHIQYGTGYVDGFLGQDTVAMGSVGDQQLVVPKTTFAQIQHISLFFQGNPIDGILGLGFQALTSDHEAPVLVNAMNQGLLDEPLFTVFLQERGSQVGVPGGVFTYGGLDTDNCNSEFAYVPLTEALWWQYKLDAFQIGDKKFSQGWQVISDTGTTAFITSSKFAKLILKKMGASSYDASIDCNAKGVDLTLTVGGKDYVIPAAQLILHNDDGTCAVAVEADPQIDQEGGPWILGGPWLRSYCQVFNMKDKTVGFAKVK